MRLASYARHFGERVAGLSPNTRARYASELRRHILPALGARPLERIDATVAQRFLATLLQQEKLAAATICSAGHLLLRVLKSAAAEGHRAHAIDARALVWPREQRARAEPRAFSREETARILAHARPSWIRTLFALLAMTGLRAGEGLGLDWSHVELESAMLHVRQQASRGRLRTLKSRVSAADLPLHHELQPILAEFWREQGSPSAGLVFAGAGGLPRAATGIASRHLTPLLVKLQIPHAGLHAFRHGFCSACWQAGLPADTIRRLMRHSTLAMTLRYSHTAATELRAGVDRLTWPLSAST